MADVFVCKSDEMIEGGTLIVRIGHIEVGLMRHKGNLYCYRNHCPHQGGPACEGVRIAGVEDLVDGEGRLVGQRYNDEDMRIVCPWHGYEFHLETGVNAGDPKLSLQKIDVVERDGGIYVIP